MQCAICGAPATMLVPVVAPRQALYFGPNDPIPWPDDPVWQPQLGQRGYCAAHWPQPTGVAGRDP